MQIEVTRDALDAMLAEAQKRYPREACGVLLGEGERVSAFAPARNVHATPETHFDIDPQALIDAHRDARSGGLQVVGYFHSHPTGDASPSATDQAQSARDGSIWAIAAMDAKGSAGVAEIGFWKDAAQGFEPLSYSVGKS